MVLTVDEGAEQTAAIHQRQREAQTLEGLLARRARDHVQALYQNAQRLLEPLMVTNPFAPKLSFDHRRTRSRRDHVKYLTLIRAITFLHQHQRPIRTVSHLGQVVRYVEATEGDIQIADRLARVLFGGSDELPAQTQRVLEAITTMVQQRAQAEGIEVSAVRFTRRDVRQATRCGNTVLKKHFGRLEDLEYLAAHGGGARKKTHYELATGPAGEGENWSPPEAIWAPRKPQWSPPGRPLVAPPPATSLGVDSTQDIAASEPLVAPAAKAHLEETPRIVPKIGSKSRLNGHAAAGK